MAKKTALIIVESPTKAQTISGFLGKSYRVVSSYGHIRDLPKNKLGIDIENNFEPEYVVPPKAKNIVAELQKHLKETNEVILATDEDREGEAIAWHLVQALELNTKPMTKTQRIVFHEITKTAIEKALQNPRDINMPLVKAQQARRVLDRLVGYELSPFLWRKIKYGLSAGRVQSAALRLVVEREKEIQAFKSEEFWSIAALLAPQKKKNKKEEEFEAILFMINDKTLNKLEIKTKDQADSIIKDLEKASFSISGIEQKTVHRSPSPPFTTSTLQQEAWQKLHYSAKQTMIISQKLYELGYITYMRTDSTNISSQAIVAARKFIEQEYTKKYLPDKPNVYRSRSRLAQEAHEAIRPTEISKTPEQLKTKLEPKQLKIYDLIWRRFIACQMEKAEINQQTVIVKAVSKQNQYFLKSAGQIIVFNGFLKVWQNNPKHTILPALKKEQKLALLKLKPEQHFTQPPARYNDASLVKILEKLGIGRPSTYASIISTILERGYAEREERTLKPTYLGMLVNDLLVNHFSSVVDYQFTAKIEEDLDKIAENKVDWIEIVREFYLPFHKNLEEKEQQISRREATEKPSEEICDKCGSPMVIKYGKYGLFLGCSKYPDCSNIKKLPNQTNEIGVLCPKCGTSDGGKVIRRKTKLRKRLFYGCSRWPDCDFMSWKKPTETESEK